MNIQSQMDVSLIVPVYGAESFLRRSLEEIDATLSVQKESWELILVVDASPDQSLAICREFGSVARPYRITVLVNEHNLGKGATVKRGMLAAVGRYRIFNDCDLAYPMSEVMKVLQALKEGTSVAIASRACESSRYIFAPTNFRYLYTRHLASRILNAFIHRFFLPNYRDTQAGLKGFTAAAADFLFPQLKLDGFSFDLELLYLATKASLSVKEVGVDFYAQRVSTVDFAFETLRMVRDIFLITWWSARGRYNFSTLLRTDEKASDSCG